MQGRQLERSIKMQQVRKVSAKKSTIAILVLVALSFYVAVFAKYW